MGIYLKRIKSYEAWQKRKMLVLHMQTDLLDVESCLKLAGIPFLAVSYLEENLEEKIWDLSKESSGVIITGSRKREGELPSIPNSIMELDLPILGMCYAHEKLGEILGSKIVPCNPPMGERSEVEGTLYKSFLFDGIEISDNAILMMAHDYMLQTVPPGSRIIASTNLTPIAGFENLSKRIFGLQFHPEKGIWGDIIFRNFFDYCSKK